MELDFNKQKQRVAGMSDAELIARLRDPAINATDRMLIEAELSRRGTRRGHIAPIGNSEIAPKRSKLLSNVISLLIVIGVVGSILAGILEDMGIDIIEWLREFFAGKPE